MGNLSLSRTDNMDGFTNISQTISANPDEEEVWVELLSYRDKKHKDEAIEKMKGDKNCEQGYRQFLDLHYTWIQGHLWRFPSPE